MTRRVYIVDTGGTIGMKKTAEGYAPAPGYLAQRMARMPELHQPEMPEYWLHTYDPPLDSANMMPADWLKIAQDIAAHDEAYDGFVILHGTDTMAYTASALAFLLEGLRKPVILTGSQIPLGEIRNDARENLITSLLLAAHYPIPEVCLYFGDRLLRGCRAVKVDADGFSAFASPNYPFLGVVGIDIEIDWSRVRRAPADGAGPLQVAHMVPSHLASLRLFPGLSTEVFANLLRPPLQGLVLEAFGVGNGPTDHEPFMRLLREATARGVVVVDCTQCLAGSVDLSGYATGSALARAGVLSGYDLTAEAALAKLTYLFGQGLAPQRVREWMQVDMRGEMTVAGGA